MWLRSFLSYDTIAFSDIFHLSSSHLWVTKDEAPDTSLQVIHEGYACFKGTFNGL